MRSLGELNIMNIRSVDSSRSFKGPKYNKDSSSACMTCSITLYDPGRRRGPKLNMSKDNYEDGLGSPVPHRF